MHLADILGEGGKPGTAQPALRAIDQQGRADLDDDAAEVRERGLVDHAARLAAGRSEVKARTQRRFRRGRLSPLHSSTSTRAQAPWLRGPRPAALVPFQARGV